MRRRLRKLLTQVRRAVLAPLVIVGLRMVRRRATPFAMRLLYFAWSNSWAAKPDYLLAVAARIEANPPRHVLECGSGLTTLVLGVLARNSGFTVLALEDNDHWAAVTRRKLQRFDLGAVRVVRAPIEKFDSFSWYSPPAAVLEPFDLVVCDGPPTGTLGGRFGLLPVLRDYLAGATILVDDADTALVLGMLDRWRREFGAGITAESNMTRGLAVVTMPAGDPDVAPN